VQIGFDVVRKQFTQPVNFDGRGERQDGVHLAVAAFDLADFRRHEERAVLHLALARQHAAPAVDEFATQRALIQPPRHAVAEADEDALLQRLVLHLVGLRV
jgi:hypothetical protein